MARLALLAGWCALAAPASAATTKLRILYRPNNTALSPIDEPWTIEYKFTVPPDKPAAEVWPAQSRCSCLCRRWGVSPFLSLHSRCFVHHS